MMPAYLIIIIVALVFILAVKLKSPLGPAFAGCAILLGFLSGMPPKNVLLSFWGGLVALDTLKLVAIVYLLNIMGRLLDELGWLSRTVVALRRLIPDAKAIAVIPSSIIGLLPMPGGAMLSAPLCEEGSKCLGISSERLTFLNYWFRHLWEYVWPLYPGIILSIALLGQKAGVLIGAMWPLTIFSIIFGAFWGFRGVKTEAGFKKPDMSALAAFKEFIKTTWFIWAVVIFVLGFGFGIFQVVLICTLINMLILRKSDADRLRLMKKAFSWKILAMVAGVMVFNAMLKNSGALEVLASELSRIPSFLLLFAVPFSIGILTGVNAAYVGLGFPLLIPFLNGNGFDAGNFAFAYASGFTGVLLSPVHLCLILTKQYFNSRWEGIYRILLPSSAAVFAVAIIILFLS